ncbi:MAG: hypothetical protein HQL47_06930, partial [Gammaproteobacteria bacterium]|nr:hypothetical protein [Gammaproteobacteria bacterium]
MAENETSSTPDQDSEAQLLDDLTVLSRTDENAQEEDEADLGNPEQTQGSGNENIQTSLAEEQALNTAAASVAGEFRDEETIIEPQSLDSDIELPSNSDSRTPDSDPNASVDITEQTIQVEFDQTEAAETTAQQALFEESVRPEGGDESEEEVEEAPEDELPQPEPAETIPLEETTTPTTVTSATTPTTVTSATTPTTVTSATTPTTVTSA